MTILRNRSPLGSFKNPPYLDTMNTQRLQRIARRHPDQHPRRAPGAPSSPRARRTNPRRRRHQAPSLPPHQKRPRATPCLGIHPRLGPRMGTGNEGHAERDPTVSVVFMSLRGAFSPRATTVRGGVLPSSTHPPRNLFPDRERQTQTHTLRPGRRGQFAQLRKHPCHRW